MSPTAKILLGAGATGVAGYLLWRMWPKEEEVIVYPMVPPAYTPADGPTYVPTLSVMKPTRAPQPTCPPGTHYQGGKCIPFQID